MRMKRWIVLVAAGALAAGCSSSSTGPSDAGYPERTSPEGVLAKLVAAYEARDADAYLDCLSDDFVFFLNEDECIGNPGLPMSWDLATEEQIHRTMFGGASDVDSVSLSLSTFGDPVEIDGEQPGDPSGWLYDEDVDLVVHVGGPAPGVYVVTVGAELAVFIDPDSAPGETLWEITQWEDVDPFVPLAGRESITWGSFKNLFRDQK